MRPDDLLSRLSSAARAKMPIVVVLRTDARVAGRVREVGVTFVVIAPEADTVGTQRLDLRDVVRVHRLDGRLLWPVTVREAKAS